MVGHEPQSFTVYIKHIPFLNQSTIRSVTITRNLKNK